MRTRTVKPDHWKDVKLGTVSRDARTLYVGLRSMADVAGNLEYSALRIKAELFPYDQDLSYDDVNRFIGELIAIRYAIPYEADGESYLHLPRFLKDDNPTSHERKDGAKYPSFQSQTALQRPCNDPDTNKVVPGSCLDPSVTVTVTVPVTETVTALRDRAATESASPPSEPAEPVPDEAPQPKLIPIPARERWRMDEHFELLRKAYADAGVSDLLPDDWGDAHRVWGLLDSEQRQAAVEALYAHVRAGTEPQFIPRPRRWLRGEYKRPIREPTMPPRRGRISPMDAILREMS